MQQGSVYTYEAAIPKAFLKLNRTPTRSDRGIEWMTGIHRRYVERHRMRNINVCLERMALALALPHGELCWLKGVLQSAHRRASLRQGSRIDLVSLCENERCG